MDQDLKALKRFNELGNKVIVYSKKFKRCTISFKLLTVEYDYLVMCNDGLIIGKNNKIIHKKVA